MIEGQDVLQGMCSATAIYAHDQGDAMHRHVRKVNNPWPPCWRQAPVCARHRHPAILTAAQGASKASLRMGGFHQHNHSFRHGNQAATVCPGAAAGGTRAAPSLSTSATTGKVATTTCRNSSSRQQQLCGALEEPQLQIQQMPMQRRMQRSEECNGEC